MNISGYNFSTDALKNNFNTLQDFSTKSKEATENAAVNAVPATSPSNNIQPEQKAEEGVTVKISEDGQAGARAAENRFSTGNSFTTANFSTKPAEENETSKGITGNQILNQYRFFVPTTQYEGSEGVVKRIFG